jgi:predicted nucleic acid-binding protein
MLLIVDANVVFATLIVKGKTFELFVWNELNNRIEFVAPEYLSLEIENNLEEVLRKSELSKAEFEEVKTMVELQIDFIPADEFREFLPKAKDISPVNDFPYVALSMHFKSRGYEVGIWSNDKGLRKAMEKQGIEVFSTHLLLKRLGLV